MKNVPEFYILCLDDQVYSYFESWHGVKLIALSEIENRYSELKLAKENRSFVEYIFTLSPFLPLYILESFPEIKRVTTLDSDLFFLNDPTEQLEDLGYDLIGITPHGFSLDLIVLEKYGKYNVSFQSFPNTEESLNCLRGWADNCIEYCGDELDELGRFADQKYLDNWQINWANVVPFHSPKVGLAPWNIKSLNKDLKPIFYHFHNFRIKSKYHITLGLNHYNVECPTNEVMGLYAQYWNTLSKFGDALDNKLVRHSGETNSLVLLRDIKNGPIFLRFLGIHIYINFKKLLIKFYLK